MSNLHLVKDWESVIPKNARFDKVCFNDQREVTKVSGKIVLNKHVNGSLKKVYIKVHWDGFGQCYVANNKRKRNYDIKFDKNECQYN